MKNSIKKIVFTLLIMSVIFVAGCVSNNNNFDLDDEIETSTFSSIEEYENFVKAHSGGNRYYGGDRGRPEMMMTGDVVVAASASMKMAMNEQTLEYSETNVQVVDVDEADIIKTDGNFIYTISRKTLFIIKAYPGEDAKIVSEISFEDNPSNLFVNGNYLAVFGDFYDSDYFDKLNITPRSGMTYFNIYDISDRENPTLLKEYKFEGRYFQARMIEDYVYFVTVTGMEYRPVFPTPIIIEGARITSIPVKDIYYFNIPYNWPQLATIHAIDINNPQNDINSKGVAINGNPNLYMSANNIYITYTEYVNKEELMFNLLVELMEPKLSSVEKQQIEKIRNIDSEVLSDYEKQRKIMEVIETHAKYLDSIEQDALEEELESLLKRKLEEYEYFEYTIISKVNVDNGNIVMHSNGKVPGHVINQFSMDEYDSIFRIGTTVSARWSSFEDGRTESTNNIFTLDSNMNTIDHLGDLAKGERIYSTRFMRDKLYMVTFKQVDPFFVIDLSDPYNIKSLGELKIPGFSRYLHPYDENTIIGIGRDATEEGRLKGLKISLFDVTDVTNPIETAKFVTTEKYAQSVAEYEHKAFLFSKEKNLLVIPAYSYDWKEGENYNGAMVFDITKENIDLRGIIDHSSGLEGKWYSAGVERSLYIEELLYTKSTNLLRINKLEDLSSVKSVELKSSESEGKYELY